MFAKLKWILAIVIVFVLILGTNLIDRDSFVRMRDSVVTIYEDRIIASDVIFDMTLLIHEKEVAVLTEDTAFFRRDNGEVNTDLSDLAQRYDHTELTEDEQIAWRRVKSAIRQLQEREESFIQYGFQNTDGMRRQIESVQDNLKTLAKIQVVEGERQKNISQEAVDTVELFTHIEIYMLVFLAVLIQIILLYKQ